MMDKLAPKTIKPTTKLLSDRYENRSQRRSEAPKDIDYADNKQGNEEVEKVEDIDECRSLAAEIDYKRKDATRHIV